MDVGPAAPALLPKFLIAALAAAPMLPAEARGQTLSRELADSGWVSLFNGRNFEGLYTYLENQGVNGNPPHADTNHVISVKDGVIKVKGAPRGHIAAKKVFSHYRVRLDIKFDRTRAQDSALRDNAGMLYHIRENEKRLQNGEVYPRSIEFQGQKRGIGEMWVISDVYVNTTSEPTGGCRYKVGGKPVSHGGAKDRQCLGSSAPYRDGEWNTLEALVRGSDSVVHVVNGVTVFRAWKLRVSEAGRPDDFSRPLDDGTIGMQSEYAPVRYRNFMIMELDSATGRPLHAKPTALRPTAARPPAAGRPVLVREGGGVLLLSAPRDFSARMAARNLNGRFLEAVLPKAASGSETSVR